MLHQSFFRTISLPMQNWLYKCGFQSSACYDEELSPLVHWQILLSQGQQICTYNMDSMSSAVFMEMNVLYNIVININISPTIFLLHFMIVARTDKGMQGNMISKMLLDYSVAIIS